MIEAELSWAGQMDRPRVYCCGARRCGPPRNGGYLVSLDREDCRRKGEVGGGVSLGG